MSRVVLSAFVLLLMVGTATAAEIRSVNVEHSKGRYTMVSEVWFDATVPQVYEVFRQWDLSTQFSSAIVESRDEAADEYGRPQYYVRNRGCVLFFCLSFERRGYVESEPNEVLRAYANPETSDFLLSNETWTFAEDDDGTVVSYHILMKPKFWVPPGIGPYIIKRKLKNDGGDAIDRIEAIAQGIFLEPGVAGE
ncbi:MAG: hypothetical protein GY783_21400 [Gammaproteobacteria bacterium]|nr:hypothetical protein [Gammaproteobacteria bacterium]